MRAPPFLIAASSLCIGIALQCVQAQSSSGDARRAIDDSTATTPRLPAATPGLSGPELDPAIEALAEVEVLGGSPLTVPVKRYWQPLIGQRVSHDTLRDFKAWLAEEGRKRGALAFALVESKVTPDGRQTLVLTLTSPRIRAVRLLLDDTPGAAQFGDVLTSRLSAAFTSDSWLDIDGVDQHLDRISFDLPLSLEATIKPVGPERVDLLLAARPVDSQAGALKRLLLQVNNHGLKQFGREQLLGMLSVGGLTPHASANFTSLLSEGITHFSAEYEALAPVLSGRLRIFSSYSGSQNIHAGDSVTKGSTKEIGVGLTRQAISWGSFALRSHVDFISRRSVNTLLISRTIIGDIKDEQLRIGLSVDNERVHRFPTALSATLVTGHLMPSAFDNVSGGQYAKLNTRFSSSHPLTVDGRWYSLFKAQSQFASRALDSYNKFSIGGNQGVRAYTTADGVGDAGVMVALEINHLTTNGVMTGLFYDVGRVKPHKSVGLGAFDESYSLQAMGIHFSGSSDPWKFNIHIGKGLGGYKLAESQPTAAESKANPLRIAMTLSYVF